MNGKIEARIRRHPKLRRHLQREGYQQISAAPIAMLTFFFFTFIIQPGRNVGLNA